MSTCTMEEWLEMTRDYHRRMAYNYGVACQDYDEGNWWYSVEACPAYSDTPRLEPDVKVVGKVRQPKHEVIKEAEEKFMEAYNDRRPHSIVRFVRIHFISGFSFEIKEFDRELYD